MFDFWLNEPKWGISLTFYAKKKKLKKILFSAVTETRKFFWGFNGLKVGVSTKFQRMFYFLPNELECDKYLTF
jgi:hypothetical protein